MARPHPLLLDLIRGRPVDLDEIDAAVIASAQEHRVSGLLLAAFRRVGQGGPARARLEAIDMETSVAQTTLRKVMHHVRSRLDAAGVQHLYFKGAVEAYRLFDEPAQRPFADLDLCISPEASLARATSAIASDHPDLDVLDDLAFGGYISSVGFFEQGTPLDVHTDVVRVGPRSEQPQAWWEHTTTVEIPGVGRVRALDLEASMVVFALHQARDRFRYLIGTAEFSLRLGQGFDPVGVEELGRAEGLWDQVAVAIEVLSRDLDVPCPVDVPRSIRVAIWRWLWREPIRLMGPEGRYRHRRRGVWLMPVLARGRALRSFGWIMRSAIPPDAHLRRRHPHARGPYIWRLVSARLAQNRRRRRLIREVRSID